jgi:hypothetical protein
MGLITPQIIKAERQRQINLRKCHCEGLGSLAFQNEKPYKPPKDIEFPKQWRRGWRRAKEAYFRKPKSWLRVQMEKAGKQYPPANKAK